MELMDNFSLASNIVISRPNSNRMDLSIKKPKDTAPIKGTKAKKAGKTEAKKRTWKKPKDKPRRPLSAYNLFFQHERERIIVESAENPEEALSELRSEAADRDENGKRRRSRRNHHGKIGFAALAKNIAEKWKALDDASRSPFEEKAAKEKARYKLKVDEWNVKQEARKEELLAAAMKDVNGDNDTERDAESHDKDEARLMDIDTLPQPSKRPSINNLSAREKPDCALPTAADSLEAILRRARKKTLTNLERPEFKDKLFQQEKDQDSCSTVDLLNILDQATTLACDIDTSTSHSQQHQEHSVTLDMHNTCNKGLDREMPLIEATPEIPRSTKQLLDEYDKSLRNSICSITSTMQPESNSFADLVRSEQSLMHSNNSSCEYHDSGMGVSTLQSLLSSLDDSECIECFEFNYLS